VLYIYITYLLVVNVMSINPDRNNISGRRRSRSNEGNGHDEGRDVEPRNIRPRRQPIQYEQPFGRRPMQARPLTEDEILFWRQQIPLRNDRSRFYPFEANGRSNSNIEDHCGVCLEDIDPLVGNHVKAPCGHRFHVNCLNEWAQREFLAYRTVRCPICRSTDVEKLTRIPEVMVRRP